MTTLPSRVDVMIAGAGFAGLTLAIALRQAIPQLSVAIADPIFARAEGPGDPRASAIAAAPRRMFEALGVWDAIAGEAQPILDMVVTDSRPGDAARPSLLTFGGEIEPGEPFAHMIENAPLTAALLRRARAFDVTMLSAPVSDFTVEAETIVAKVATTPSDAGVVPARLLVAADGARSALRERAGIGFTGWPYDQSAIVTTVAHERDHQGRAEEHFFPSGPFAILPLRGNRSSIVWTERTPDAERLMALSDAAFHDELEARFGLHLGALSVVGARRTYPLGLWAARRFTAERLALVGDAAHVIHPIAGQGLNLGLRDVAALAESIVDAVRLGLDPGGAAVLERYQRWRRFDTMSMSISTDLLNRLFSNRSPLLRLIRDTGLGIVDRLPSVKSMFMREAAGLTGEVPRLLRGELL